MNKQKILTIIIQLSHKVTTYRKLLLSFRKDQTFLNELVSKKFKNAADLVAYIEG